MGILDALIGAGAAANLGIGIALLLRSRGRPETIVWRRRPLPAPRVAASMHLSMGLSFSFVTVAHVFFEPGGFGYGLLLLAALVSIGVTIVAAFRWYRRREVLAGGSGD